MTTRRRLLKELTSTNAPLLEKLFLVQNKINREQNRRIESLPTPTGQPKLVIKYGPPASGKSSTNPLVEQVGGDPIRSYININIDDAVESTEYFKRRSRIMIQRLVGNRNPTEQMLRNFLNKATNKEITKLGQVYSTVRKTKNLSGSKFSDKIDSLIQKAVNAGKNIMFETTGSNAFPNWLFQYIQGANYKTFIVFPMAPFQLTWQRYKNRPVRNYLAGGGFRFASSKGALAQTYRLSYDHFINAFSNTRNPVYRYVNGVYMVPTRANRSTINFNPKINANRRRVNWGPALREYINRINNEGFI